jgi:hypothetical protein
VTNGDPTTPFGRVLTSSTDVVIVPRIRPALYHVTLIPKRYQHGIHTALSVCHLSYNNGTNPGSTSRTQDVWIVIDSEVSLETPYVSIPSVDQDIFKYTATPRSHELNVIGGHQNASQFNTIVLGQVQPVAVRTISQFKM